MRRRPLTSATDMRSSATCLGVARVLVVVAVLIGVASLVLALMDPSTPGPWLTALAMVFVAGAQVAYLRRKSSKG
jgi:hypothetical protein